MGCPPVEYAVAVDRYLSACGLGAGSRRVYRIALTTWAWALVDRVPPAGDRRRNAAAPAVPLALLDTPAAAARIRTAFAARSAAVGPRTANRELSALRSASAWWRGQGWLVGDPLAGLRALPAEPRDDRAPLGPEQARAVLELAAPLREQTLWHLLYETAAPIGRLLALDVDHLDLAARRTRAGDRARPVLRWGPPSARLLPLLALGHPTGPLFRTAHGRLSYRQAAGLFTAATARLTGDGSGWTLRQLRGAARPSPSHPEARSGTQRSHSDTLRS